MQESNKNKKNKIAVIGAGYVGLVAGACLSDLGNEVICIDKDKEKIRKLNKKNVPLYEPGLSEMVKKSVEGGRLFFSTDLPQSIQNSEIIFVCVGTPLTEDGKVNLSYLKNVAREIGKSIQKPKIIVTKSTVPTGTGNNLLSEIISKYWSGDFEIASNPEFLREGTAVSDFLNPDRIVIGVNSPRTAKVLLNLYKNINCPKIITTIESAEMIKYASNAFLATKISFINEIANICEKTKADIEQVALGMGLDKRIGKHFLKPGLGYGGSCLPKDTKVFHQLAGANGYNFRLLKSAIEVNNYQREKIIKKIENLYPGERIRNKKIAVLGLAFKENTDDIRESAAMEMVRRLQKLGARIKTYDPKAMENAKKNLNHKIEFCNSPYEAAESADLLVIATEWEQFKKLDWKRMRQLVRKPLIIDGRNLLDPIKIKKLGFRYIGVGRNI